ncbi:ADP,ATP carrier protein, mitochondrial-like [Capsicum annuum]|uniref:ADP,ATP carrier protein, mitochondrial-like n=1 Tax=Capsicum annuum TaxID=4072 RepID=UPI001FB0DFD4|nr:ADP,ATP carrier protein, mitochondrial-like [Capsicum annuum]
MNSFKNEFDHATKIVPTGTSARVFVQAPAEKGVAAFATDFLMGGVSAGFSKTASAPIERLLALVWWFLVFFVYSLDYACTRIENDAKAAKKGGERQFNGMIDIYRKTLTSDGVAGLYRGLYFGMYDSLKPVLLTGGLHGT